VKISTFLSFLLPIGYFVEKIWYVERSKADMVLMDKEIFNLIYLAPVFFFAQATFVHVQKVPKIFLNRKFFVPSKKVFFGT